MTIACHTNVDFNYNANTGFKMLVNLSKKILYTTTTTTTVLL